MDAFSKSDPYCKVEINNGGQWGMIGKTEVKQNQNNPDFEESFIINYQFEKNQPIRFEFWDKDDGPTDDFIGTAESSIGDICGAVN